jgi:citrate lyase subunit beta/citryl-CoA lyase
MSASEFTARSLLFAPGDSERKMAKALASEADLVLLDLEDAVAESAKPAARELTAATLRARKPGGPLVYVRINPLDTAHALIDLAAIVAAKPDGLMLPKATRADLDLLHNYLTALEVQAGVEQGAIKVIVVATETPKALFGLGDYCGAPRLAALTWGAEDIATALGATHNRDETGVYEFPYQLARTLCLAGAANAKVPAIETIHGDFRDPDGLKAVASAARRAGFRSMMAIHPDQVATINAAFSPSEQELARAQRIVDLFDANPGAGTLGLDGEMLDMPHLKRARAVLAMVRR